MELLTLALLFSTTTQVLDLPRNLLGALCFVESSHNVKALSEHDGKTASIGVCQIKLETARLLGFKGTKKQLMNPKINIYYAGLYLKKQLVRYNKEVTKAVAAYNAGSYRESKYGGGPINKRYVRKVMSEWQKNKSALPLSLPFELKATAGLPDFTPTLVSQNYGHMM